MQQQDDGKDKEEYEKYEDIRSENSLFNVLALILHVNLSLFSL